MKQSEFATEGPSDTGALEQRVDDFEAKFVQQLDRCLRRQLWTVVGALTVAIVVMSAIFGAFLAAFGRQQGAALVTPVFATIAVVAAIIGMLRSD